MINIYNRSNFKIKPRLIKSEIENVVKFLEKKYKQKHICINYCFVDLAEIISLNREFLKKNKPTDVLTFIDRDDMPNISGDIAICLDVVKEDALKDGKSFEGYLIENILHGALHLFGLKHTYSKKSLEEVYQLQDEILKKLKLNWKAFNVRYTQ